MKRIPLSPPVLSPFTAIREHLARADAPTTSLGELRHALGDKGFGYLLALSLLPSLVPIPGIGMIVGFLPFLLGLQMLLGWSEPWLPKAVLGFRLPREKLLHYFDHAEDYWRRYVPTLRPSWPWVFSAGGERFMGLLTAFLSAIIILPGPLTNILPAIPLFMLAGAITTRDGRMALTAYATAAIITLFLLALYGGLFYLLATGLGNAHQMMTE